MGSLKPGATYIYEKADGVTYAREFGSSERRIIGYDATAVLRHNARIWNDILIEAESNPALQLAVERVIMIYKLSKEQI